MRIRIGRRRKIQFTDKKHPLQGIISMLIAFASFIFMIVLFVCAGKERGNGGPVFGYLGIVTLLFSAVGFFLALRCYKREDVYMTTPAAGAFINGIIIIIYLILYFLGAL